MNDTIKPVRRDTKTRVCISLDRDELRDIDRHAIDFDVSRSQMLLTAYRFWRAMYHTTSNANADSDN